MPRPYYKSFQLVNSDLHTRVKTLAASAGEHLNVVVNKILKNGLLLNERWDELSDSTKDELKKHRIEPFR